MTKKELDAAEMVIDIFDFIFNHWEARQSVE